MYKNVLRASIQKNPNKMGAMYIFVGMLVFCPLW
uniref:Uncharacterized protein n=1 Tax=Anguilla anguilla TaxID=7936 RepID=A0A0E9TBJ5_ANGAN